MSVNRGNSVGENDFSEPIEICCPVCGSTNLNRDEMGQMSCEECDYTEEEI
jgi:ribosomal protein L37AE/L43A